jgi:hypothetical protein
MTTIRVSWRIMRFIAARALPDESVDSTLRRLLRIDGVRAVPRRPDPVTATIKISRAIMDRIVKESRSRESRDETLSRLLRIAHDDGNARVQAR